MKGILKVLSWPACMRQVSGHSPTPWKLVLPLRNTFTANVSGNPCSDQQCSKWRVVVEIKWSFKDQNAPLQIFWVKLSCLGRCGWFLLGFACYYYISVLQVLHCFHWVHVHLFVGLWKQAWIMAVCFQWCNWQAETEALCRGFQYCFVAIHRFVAGSLGLQLFVHKIWAHLPWRYHLCLLCDFFFFPPLVFLLLLLLALVSLVFCLFFFFAFPFFGVDAFNFVLILRWLEIFKQIISEILKY